MKIDWEKYGFRKDFDYNNRFDLKTIVEDYQVSTVDLGINHQFDENLPPLYYETMIFPIANGEVLYLDLYCERYTTEEEARIGHQKAIDYVKYELMEGSDE